MYNLFMSNTQKLELDPYYKNLEYISDFRKCLEFEDLRKAKVILEGAKIFDLKFYEGEFPNFEEISAIYEEFGYLEEAKEILLDVRKNSKNFYKRAYLNLYGINKKLGLDEENKQIILEARKQDENYFLTYGYKKLIEILMSEKNYKGALQILEMARKKQILNLGEDELINYHNLPEERKKSYFPDFEDYRLRIEILEKLKN